MGYKKAKFYADSKYVEMGFKKNYGNLEFFSDFALFTMFFAFHFFSKH